jgi:hypothetical protein
MSGRFKDVLFAMLAVVLLAAIIGPSTMGGDRGWQNREMMRSVPICPDHEKSTSHELEIGEALDLVTLAQAVTLY